MKLFCIIRYRIILNIHVFLDFLKHKIKKIEKSVKTGGREKFWWLCDKLREKKEIN